MNLLLLTIRIIIGTVFLLSGLSKIAAMREFSRAVAAYEILPHAITVPAAYLLPWFELALGIVILFGWHIGTFSAISAALLTLFTLAVLVNITRGQRDLACGCFGALVQERMGWKILIRNVWLTGAALVLALRSAGLTPTQSVIPLAGYAVLALLVLLLMLLGKSIGDVIKLRHEASVLGGGRGTIT